MMYNLKQGVFCIVCLAAAHLLPAQDSLKKVKVLPKHAFKWSPLHLINFYPTIQAAYEYRFTDQYSLQLDGGYIVNFPESNNTRFQNKRGTKLRLEGRYYFGIQPVKLKAFYGAVELYYNAVNFDREESRVECFDIDCNNPFIRNYVYKVRYRENGLGLKLGYTKFYNRFLFDINTGWAIRNVNYIEPSWLDQGDNWDDWVFVPIPNERKRIAIMPLLGIRIGYHIANRPKPDRP